MKISGFAINADAGLLDGNLEMLCRELSYYRETGFTHVEISPHGIGAVSNGRLIPGCMERLNKILGSYPFRYTVHGPNSMNLMNTGDLETERSLFIASIEFTRAVGADILVYHCGRYIPEENFLNPHFNAPDQSQMKSMWDTERRLLQEMADIAEPQGITICLENARPYLDGSPYCYAEKPDELEKMVKEVGRRNVGVCLDVGHAYLAAGFYKFDFLAAVKSIATLVRHIHLHDNCGKTSTSYEKKQAEMAAVGRGDMHMPIGWGTIPLAGVFLALQDYSGVITLEMRSRYRLYYSEALQRAREMAKLFDVTMVSNL